MNAIKYNRVDVDGFGVAYREAPGIEVQGRRSGATLQEA
jgi:hypothetical protein